jgi:hypothetical protein
MVSAPLTIDDVIAQMRAIDTALPQGDGVAWFNKLYLAVTEAVRQSMREGQFVASRFLERLDVVFAGRYFRAYEVGKRDPGAAPKAWAPLFAARERRDVAPIQFGLAGMNAHINYDLGLALVETAGELGIKLERRTAEHRDFEQVNSILVATEQRVKHWFATGFVAVIDRVFGRLDDVLAMWNVERARDQAWTTAETLVRLADTPELRSQYLGALEDMVGFAGRGLLIPTATDG